MNVTAQLLNIMYAPRLYAHTEHWPAVSAIALPRVPASIANQRLIDIHRLQTHVDFSMPADPLLAQCIAHWKRLPRICLLIGVQCFRDALMDASHYTRLDTVCQQFLCLPIPFMRSPNDQATEKIEDAAPPPLENALIEAGLTHISGLLRQLPAALRQRLALLFPCALEGAVRALNAPVPATVDHPATGLNLTLFSLAINHALLEPSSIS